MTLIDVVEEITVQASAEQIGIIVDTVGRGDVPAAAVIAFDIAAGGAVEIVKASGDILEGAKNAICSLSNCQLLRR